VTLFGQTVKNTKEIYSGTLAIGMRLPSVRHLTAQYGVGQTAVFRAPDLLAEKGLMHARERPGHGTTFRVGCKHCLLRDKSVKKNEWKRADCSPPLWGASPARRVTHLRRLFVQKDVKSFRKREPVSRLHYRRRPPEPFI
jgi:DNA-binding transcriptional MocR family regulator